MNKYTFKIYADNSSHLIDFLYKFIKSIERDNTNFIKDSVIEIKNQTKSLINKHTFTEENNSVIESIEFESKYFDLLNNQELYYELSSLVVDIYIKFMVERCDEKLYTTKCYLNRVLEHMDSTNRISKFYNLDKGMSIEDVVSFLVKRDVEILLSKNESEVLDYFLTEFDWKAHNDPFKNLIMTTYEKAISSYKENSMKLINKMKANEGILNFNI